MFPAATFLITSVNQAISESVFLDMSTTPFGSGIFIFGNSQNFGWKNHVQNKSMGFLLIFICEELGIYQRFFCKLATSIRIEINKEKISKCARVGKNYRVLDIIIGMILLRIICIFFR
jgi:hypothetical protein